MRRAPRPLRLPARGLVPLAIAALMFGVRYDADAAATRHKDSDGALIEGTQGLPDLARGRQAAADGRLDAAEADLKPLAERGYVEAQIALGKLYARIGTPERIAAAIRWLRTARDSSPEPTEVPLGRLLIREDDAAALSEGEGLLNRAWQHRQDPEALAGLIRLYSEHPQRDTEQRVGALVVRAETVRQPDVQGAVIGWYRSTPQIDGHRDKVAQLCARWLEGVPECHVDLARAARAGGDVDYLKKLVSAAGERYEQGMVPAATLAALARALVDAPDESAEADAAAPAALPVKISDVPEDEGEASLATLRVAGGGEAQQACASEPVSTAHADPAAATADAPAPAAQPDLANALLDRLLHGREEAPALAAGVVARYPYLLPGVDIESALKQGLERGVPEARLYLGQLYLAGARAPRNPQLALGYLQQAAATPATALQGHYFLGRLYQYGYLDESQPLLAAEHLMWAARRGYVAADGALARLFANGKGLCPDLLNAYVFAKLGAREGSASTAALQQQIAAQLTPTQIAAADHRFDAELQARPSAYEIPKTLLAQQGEAAVAIGGAAPTQDAAAMPARQTDDATTDDVAAAAPPSNDARDEARAATGGEDAAASPVATASAAPPADAAAPEAPPLAAATPALPHLRAPTLSFSKTLSYHVPLEAPVGAAGDAAASGEEAQAVLPRREIRLSHKPSEDAATRALLAEPETIEYENPLQTPAPMPAGAATPATPAPAPSVRVDPTGGKS
ncbi:tetratricopeptide repeat protein [Solimonas soli]|uniref:tetratricopeptide repeat protein n=1 Tax=Solimonas soli TaxID=413479 RepID=UPI0004863317|nr:sel1 repeat family protein [Solimonas soli]